MEGHTVQRTADGVDDPAQQLPAYADIGYAAGALNRCPGVYGVAAAEEGGADAVQSQIQGDTIDVVLKFQQFAVLRPAQSGDPHDAVGTALDCTVFIADHFRMEIFQLIL